MSVSIKKEIVVGASQERCFSVFTSGMTRWWPKEHHIGKTPLKQVIIEPRVGGRWYSTHEGGEETDTGRVVAWDPSSHLLMTWQITAEWTYDPDFVTEVELSFIAQGPKSTLVRLEHRGLERYGSKAEEMKQAFAADGGWSGMLGVYAKVAAE